jgi:adenosylcobinamide-GDP ribazoletransferase
LRILKAIRNTLAFLTILPVGMDSDGLTLAAEYMPIFPLIGGFIGLVAGGLSWILDLVLPPLLVGTIGLGTILLMNGAQHVDGLLDFGDGIMCHGSRARKLSVMRDPQTGAGGFTLGWITLSATAFAIASLHRGIVIQARVVSEAAGAFSMVFQAWAGHPAHKGMSSGFVTAMHSRWRNLRILSSVLILMLIAFPTLLTLGLAVTCAAVLVPSIMLQVSNRAFGGITGDVMGATHEMTRLVSLVIILAGFGWV